MAATLYCVLRHCSSVAIRGNIPARCADTRNVSEHFQKHLFVSRTQNMCLPQMLRAWQNEATFWKHSNVAATMSLFCWPLMPLDALPLSKRVSLICAPQEATERPRTPREKTTRKEKPFTCFLHQECAPELRPRFEPHHQSVVALSDGNACQPQVPAQHRPVQRLHAVL